MIDGSIVLGPIVFLTRTFTDTFVNRVKDSVVRTHIPPLIARAEKASRWQRLVKEWAGREAPMLPEKGEQRDG